MAKRRKDRGRKGKENAARAKGGENSGGIKEGEKKG